MASNHQQNQSDSTPGSERLDSSDREASANCPEEQEAFEPTPRSITFKYLSILWILPSFGAIWILVAESRNVLSKASLLAKLTAVSIEQWLALVLLLLHVTFVGLARHYRQKEKTAEVARS